MNSIFFLVLRRMRAPLIVLIAIYAVSVLGLTLVPGVDANGQPAPPLSFFHAFYFISYTATTIGFGEIPGAFSDAQRLWVTVCIYLTVIGWSYSILTLLALLQDKGFQNTLVGHPLRAARAPDPGVLLSGLRLRRNRQPGLPYPGPARPQVRGHGKGRTARTGTGPRGLQDRHADAGRRRPPARQPAAGGPAPSEMPRRAGRSPTTRQPTWRSPSPRG